MIFRVNLRQLLSGNEMIQILLPIHILAGIIALTSSTLAVSPGRGKKLSFKNCYDVGAN